MFRIPCRLTVKSGDVVSPEIGSIAELYAEAATSVETSSWFIMAEMLHSLCAVLARYWLAEYMAAMKSLMSARSSWLVRASSRTVKADDVNGWMKSFMLVRRLGRVAFSTRAAWLENGYVNRVA